MTTIDLRGRVALVTGAGGVGIGYATAASLAEVGASVVVSDLKSARADDAAGRIAEEFGTPAYGIGLDVLSETSFDAVVDSVLGRFGGIDILVNNAGGIRRHSLDDMPLSAWRYTMDLCLTSQFLGLRSVLPHMKSAGGGSIVNVASVAAMFGGTDHGETAYAAAKAGVCGFTRAAAAEVGRFGVRVNAVSPGLAMNPMLAASVPPRYVDAMSARTVLSRNGEPGEVAAAVRFLASDDAAFVTGEILSVSGGYGLLSPGPESAPDTPASGASND